MVSEWKSCELGDIIELKRGYDLPKTERIDGKVPVVSSSGSSGEHNEAKVAAPGVVTGRYGTIGKVFYIQDDFWPLNTTLYVKDFKGNDPLYVYYFLKTISYSDYSDKGAVPGINRNHIHKAKVKVPSCPKLQNKIALILFDLDKKITLNRQTNQTLELIAQTLFKSWFVDFDPVFDNALLAANYQLENLPADFPDELRDKAQQRLNALQNNSGKGVLEGGKRGNKDFPSEFEFNEQLGWIPMGWEDGSFENVADALSGYAFKGKDFSVDGYAVIKIKNISTDRTVDIFDVNRIPPEIGISASRFLLSDGDIIMAMTGAGSVGRFGVIASESNEPYYLNQRVCKLSPKLKNGSPFLFAALNKTGVEEGIFKGAQGSGQPNISAYGILATKLLVPNVKSIELFNTLLMEAFNQKITLRKESYTLTKLRDTLLPKLISGELQVPSLRTSGEKTA